MSRNRLTWNQNRQASSQLARQASRRKFADPYTMNQERVHVPTEDYMIGDPAAWAETPVDDLSYMDGTDRDEIGLPDIEGVEDHAWNDGEYDNADTFEAGDELEGRQASRIASMQRHFEKKAYHCLRIAEAMLPGADEDELAEQALDLMDLPDDNVIATSSRLSSFYAYAGEEVEEEDEKKEAKSKKKASNLTPDQMLRIMLAEEEGEDEEEEEGKESSIREIVAQELAAMFGNRKRAGDDEDEDETEGESEEEEEDEDGSEDESEEEEEGEKEAKGKKKANNLRHMVREIMSEQGYTAEGIEDDHMDDTDIDALLDELEMEEDYVGADMGLDLEPSMDELDSEMLLEETDETLEALMNRHYSIGGRSAKKASSKATSKKASKGIKSLGRVKEAGTTDDDLSKLWGMAPDVSKIFGK